MSVNKKKNPSLPYQNWLVPGIIGLALLAGIGFLVKVMLTDVRPRQKEQISTVTLLKPPPPDVKEKPPEPEVPKEVPKQTIESPVNTPQPQEPSPSQSADNTPAGSDLGVDGDGSAGSDSFGLVGKKGGRALTLGNNNGMNRINLLAKFGRYVQKVQEEIRAQVNRQLEQNGGIPKGKYHTLVKITLNGNGQVTAYKITASSGQQKIDNAVREALAKIRISESLPEGMPSGMTIKITSQG